MSLFNLFKKKRRANVIAAPDHFDVPGVVYAVGDIHGMSGLLNGLLEQIFEDADKYDPSSPKTLVFMGDYVDRGPDSHGVLKILSELQPDGWTDVLFLRGNHEAIMLDFIEDPLTHREWLDWGGIPTLSSFGIPSVLASSSDDELMSVAQQLRAALGECHGFLVSKTVLSHRIGNLLFCHAAMLPDVPYEQQPDEKLLWGSRRFMETGGIPGYWTVHGHVIVDLPKITGNRIAIDTGAYISNTLTAARISKEGCKFIQQN